MFALKSLGLIVAIYAASLAPNLNGEKAGMQKWGPAPLLQKQIAVAQELLPAGFALNQAMVHPLLQKHVEGVYPSLLSSIDGVKPGLPWLTSPPGIDSPIVFNRLNMNTAQVLRQRNPLKEFCLTG